MLRIQTQFHSLFTFLLQWNLDLVTLLVSQKTVTKSRVVTKFIAYAYKVSINSKFYVGTKIVIYFFPLWTAAMSFFKNWVTVVTLVRFLSCMNNTLCFLKCEIWSQMFSLQILHIYDFFPLWIAALCFFKNQITKVKLVWFLSYMNSNLMLFKCEI